MTRLKKGVIAAAAVATVGVAGLTATQAVLAATDSTDNPESSLVDKLATKFGLNKSDVQAVFDEDHSEREAEHEAKAAERLQALVDDGTITAEQKTAIEAKIAEMKAERESERDSFKDLSADERKAKMEEKKAELDKWAEENGIDLTKLRGILMGGRGGHGPGGPGHGHMDDDSQEGDTQTETE